MRVPVHLPDLGTSPVVLTVWLADVGEAVGEGDGLLEVLLPGTTVEIAAPVAGWLVAKLGHERQDLCTGQLVAEIETDEPN
jgi:pyruvate/2-oxoglutarate dehydrogenase complex dihydrolipoamide acyltransferase (E2) component